MNLMFIGCRSLQKLNFNKNINTKNADKIYLMLKRAKDELKITLENHIENIRKKANTKNHFKWAFLYLLYFIIVIIILCRRFNWIKK